MAAQPLSVLTVFFGELPPWLPLTLTSMELNPRINFTIIGDATPPDNVPPNVNFEHIPWDAMQEKLSKLTESRVVYREHYKANDIKPLLPELFPHLVHGFEWWAWADLDVIFGDVLKFLSRAKENPACCKDKEVVCSKRLRRDPASPCYNASRPREAADTFRDKLACTCVGGERVSAMSPLYPNPWRKKCWGPFTAFRVDRGRSSDDNAGLPMGIFRETRKWRQLIASPEYAHFDEWWGPYSQRGFETMGDVMTRLADRGQLIMSKSQLPFAEAKSCADIECSFCPCGAVRFELGNGKLVVNDLEVMILHLAESKPSWRRLRAPLPPFAPHGHDAGHDADDCVRVERLGAFTPHEGLRSVAHVLERRTALKRHRPVDERAAVHLLYGDGRPASDAVVSVGRCVARNGFAAEDDGEEALRSARVHYNAIASSYLQEMDVERRRAIGWMCAWSRLSAVYASMLANVDLSRPESLRLPEVHGNRRVRTPLWAGERIGWWKQSKLWTAPPDGQQSSACSPPAGAEDVCVRSRDARGKPTGKPCLELACGSECSVAQLREAFVDGYFELHRARDVQVIRSRRWRCSWLYELRACLTAEAISATGARSNQSCRSVMPPDEAEPHGWEGEVPTQLSLARIKILLLRWRCW